MGKTFERLSRRGESEPVAAAGSGTERITITPGLRDANGNTLSPNAIELSNGFHVVSIQDNPLAADFGTFDVQNRQTVQAACVWTASYLHSVQDNPLEPEVLVSAVSIRAPLSFPGGESNTGANVGGFSEVFRDKTGTTLNFRTLQSSDNSLTITQNANDLDVVVAGGGGGADIRPNRLTVGNSNEGDTALTCDLLFDTADLPASSAALKALIEGATPGTDILIKQGLYAIDAASLPFNVPQGCIVSGVGGGNPELQQRGTVIVCTDSFAVFVLANLSELRNLGIGLEYSGVGAIPGAAVVSMPNLSVCQNVRVYTSGIAAGNNTILDGVFVAAGQVQVLDCVVDCDFSNTAITGGVPAVRLNACESSIVRLQSLRSDQMLIWTEGRNCDVSCTGLTGRVGLIEGVFLGRFRVNALTQLDTLGVAALSVDATLGVPTSVMDIAGSIASDPGAAANADGLEILLAVSSRYSLTIQGYRRSVVLVQGQDNSFVGTHCFPNTDGGEPNVLIASGPAPAFGLLRTVFTGCTIEGLEDGIAMSIGEAADRTAVTGCAIRIPGAASTGIAIGALTTNTVIVGNVMDVGGTKITDASADAPTAAALVAAAALNP